MSRPNASLRPFEEAVFKALGFTADQVAKVEISIGKRSQSATIKFMLTPEQVEQLDAMAAPGSPESA